MEEVITYEQKQQISIDKKPQRYSGLDFFKFICAFLVVCIHIRIPHVGYWVVAIARVAVPFFFMVTGFFFPMNFNKEKQKRQLKKVLILTLFANVLYIVVKIIIEAISGGLGLFLAETFTLDNLIKFLVFNDPFAGAHNWYLNALLYALVLLFVITKFVNIKKIYFLIPVLLVANMALQVLGEVFPDTILGSNLLIRNFLFMGLPFILLGNYLRAKQFNIKKLPLIIGVFAFLILTVLEKMFFNRVFNFHDFELWFSSIFFAISLFLFALKIDNNNKVYLFVSKCGRDYSSIIYVIHTLIIFGIAAVLEIINVDIINKTYEYAGTFIVFFASLVVAYLYVLIIKAIKTKKELKKNDTPKG